MSEQQSPLEALIRASMEVSGASIDEADGVLTCLLPSNSRLRALLGRDVVRLAFAGTFTSGKEVPHNVEIVLPGRPVFEAILAFAQEQSCLAVVARTDIEPVLQATQHFIDWGDTFPEHETVDLDKHVLVYDHYFKLRFMSQNVEERMVCVSVDPKNDIVSVCALEAQSIDDYQDLIPSGDCPKPSPDEIEVTAKRAKWILQYWIDREAEPMQRVFERQCEQAELRIRAYFDRRREERHQKEAQIEARAKRRGAAAPASPQLERIRSKLQVEEQEDTATLAGRLEELHRRFRLWEVQAEPIGCVIVWTRRSVRQMEITRGTVKGTAVFWHDGGEPDESGPVCDACFHTGGEFTLCSDGHVVCQTCIVACDCCGKPICRACAPLVCAVCGKLLGAECATRCAHCGHTVCRKHGHECDKGHGWYCERCVVSCAKPECGRSLCPQCKKAAACHQCGKSYCWECRPVCMSCGKVLCPRCASKNSVCSVCGVGICSRCEPLKLWCVGCGERLCGKCGGRSYTCASCGALMCRKMPNHRGLLSECEGCGRLLCADCCRKSRVCRLCQLSRAEAEASRADNTRRLEIQQRQAARYLLRVAKNRGHLRGINIVEVSSVGYPWTEPWRTLLQQLVSAGVRLSIRTYEADPVSVLSEMDPQQSFWTVVHGNLQNLSLERCVSSYLAVWRSYVECLYSFPNVEWSTRQKQDPLAAFRMISGLARAGFPNWRLPARRGSELQSDGKRLSMEEGSRILLKLGKATRYVTQWELDSVGISGKGFDKFKAAAKKRRIKIIEKPPDNDEAWRNASGELIKRWEKLKSLLAKVNETTQPLLQIVLAAVGPTVLQIAKDLDMEPVDAGQLTVMAAYLVLRRVPIAYPGQLLFAVEWVAANLLYNYGLRPLTTVLPVEDYDLCDLEGRSLQPAEEAHRKELSSRADRILNTLSYLERQITKLTFGIGDELESTYTAGEIGRIFKVSSTTICRIQAKAIRKLQHPLRAQELVGFLVDQGGSPRDGLLRRRLMNVTH